MENGSLNKWTSIELLKKLSLNTTGEKITSQDELTRAFISLISPDNLISIRSFKENTLSFSEPFFPNHKVNPSFIQQLKKLLEDGYILIGYKPIKPEDTLWRGNIGFVPSRTGDDYHIVAEVKEGGGTVRDLANETYKSMKILVDRGDVIQLLGNHGKNLLKGCDRILEELKPKKTMVVEWSVYPYGIGDKKEQLIYWEVRVGQ